MEKETQQTITVKLFNGFSMYRVFSTYVIEYSSSWQRNDKAKTFKTLKTASDTWDKILSGKIDYTNF